MRICSQSQSERTQGVTVRSMDLVSELLFDELLALLDVSWEPSAGVSDRFACEHLGLECPPPAIDAAAANAGPIASPSPTPALELLRRRRARCRLFHIFPRFARPLPGLFVLMSSMCFGQMYYSIIVHYTAVYLTCNRRRWQGAPQCARSSQVSAGRVSSDC